MTDHSLSIFSFNENQVRVIVINGEPWFVALDVCKVLEISNSRDALTRLDDDEKDDVGISDAMNRIQSMSVISESGLYSLVLTSRKPEAKAFKKWLTSEVIPSIRKVGSYSTAIPVQKLPPKRDAVDLINASKDLVFLEGRLPAAMIQLLRDQLGDQLCELSGQTTTTVLPSARLVGAAQKAEEMGYKVTSKNRVRLGKFVSAQGLISSKESRLCNGQLRDINVYEDSEELELAITRFFA